jgi:chromosome segregation ATPase
MVYDGIRNFKKERQSPIDSEVKVYHWTPEQVKEHFGGVGRVRKAKLTKEEYIRMRQQGMIDADITTKIGLSHGSVYHYKKKWFKDIKNCDGMLSQTDDGKTRVKIGIPEKGEKINVELELENQKLKKQKEELQAQIQRMTESAKNNTEDIRHKDAIYNKLKSELEEYKELVQEYKIKISSKDASLQSLNDEKVKIEQRLVNERRDLKKALEELTELRSKVIRLTPANAEIQEAKDKLLILLLNEK